MTAENKESNLNVFTITSRDDVDKMAELLKSYIDNGCSISFWETFSHTKVKEPTNGVQLLAIGTGVPEKDLDNICNHVVLSFTKNTDGSEPEVLKDIEEGLSL